MTHPRLGRSEADRIRAIYEGRARTVDPRRYSPLLPANILAQQERDRAFLTGLVRRGIRDLADLEILEIGCGTGGELVRLVGFGAQPARLHGIDLREDAVAAALLRVPADIRVGDAASLPFADSEFDLLLQMTALSSMPSTRMREDVANEMARVTRPGGIIVSYDFWTNPRNRDTVGIDGRELRRLFPGWQVDAHRVTLAPPIARRVAPISMRVASLIGALPLVRTHLLAFLEKGAATVHG